MTYSVNATKARYFLLGLEAGMVSEQVVRDWAYSEIESQDEPPIEIIEVASSRTREQLWASLKCIPGEPDSISAGRQLLGLLATDLPSSYSELLSVARKAMQVSRSAGLPDDVYYAFDQIDDEISLAANDVYGTLDWCRQNLAEELKNHAHCPQSETQPVSPADAASRRG